MTSDAKEAAFQEKLIAHLTKRAAKDGLNSTAAKMLAKAIKHQRSMG